MADKDRGLALARGLFPDVERQMGTVVVLAVYAVVVLCPNISLLPWPQSLFDEKRLLQMTLLVGGGLALLTCSRSASACRGTWETLPRLARFATLLVFFLGVLSSLLAAAPRYALLETSHWGLLLCMTLLVASLARDTNGRLAASLAVALLAAVALYLAAFATVYLAARSGGDALSPALLLPGFANMRFLSQFQTWTLPLLALPLIAWFKPGRWQRTSLRLLLGGWWFIAFVAEGRGTMIALLVAFAACGLAFRGAARAMLAEQLLGILLGLALYAVLLVWPAAESTASVPAIQIAAGGSGLNHRGDLWDHAVTMTRDNPWFGVGPLHYAYYRNPVAAHPHNALLQWSAEWGLPATLLAVSLLAWGLCRWLHLCRALGRHPEHVNQQRTAIVLTAAALAAAVHATVSGIIVMPLSQLMLAVVVGLMLGLHQANTQTDRAAGGQASWRVRLAGGVLAAATVGLMLPDLVTGMSGQAEHFATTLAATGPRFWMFGDFPH